MSDKVMTDVFTSRLNGDLTLRAFLPKFHFYMMNIMRLSEFLVINLHCRMKEECNRSALLIILHYAGNYPPSIVRCMSICTEIELRHESNPIMRNKILPKIGD